MKTKEKTDEQKLYYVLQSCLFYSQDNDVDSGTVNTIHITIMGDTKKMTKSFDLDDKSFCEVIDEMYDFVRTYRRRYRWGNME